MLNYTTLKYHAIFLNSVVLEDFQDFRKIVEKFLFQTRMLY